MTETPQYPPVHNHGGTLDHRPPVSQNGDRWTDEFGAMRVYMDGRWLPAAHAGGTRPDVDGPVVWVESGDPDEIPMPLFVFEETWGLATAEADVRAYGDARVAAERAHLIAYLSEPDRHQTDSYVTGYIVEAIQRGEHLP